ncbi:hypothetical protein ACN42_g687 [Penicillium freii]|uniref:Uncharacterized protein n=1 Tax=Penicillium freii TaxID=48697 RepID=A0A101MTD4_PENFR|nr:hypothetical protein ACN42_g687 [Penicillium freii]
MRLGADQNEVQEQEMLQPAFGSFTWAEMATYRNVLRLYSLQTYSKNDFYSGIVAGNQISNIIQKKHPQYPQSQ